MRHLNGKQKRILSDWYEKNKEGLCIGFRLDMCDTFDIMPSLEEINDYETLYQDINRCINDWISNEMVAKWK